MTTLYLVISPNGNIAYAGSDAQRAEFYKPQEATNGYETVVYGGYELYTVEADTPWLTEREKNKPKPEPHPKDGKRVPPA